MHKTIALLLIIVIMLCAFLPISFEATTEGVEQSTKGIEQINAAFTSGF
ncbi:hypothetical protein HOI18_00655 [Candidatus Uhrbacteria bacterium]|jgi:hypothetical protein|nr:hypothetical protein [Candidatus Uhrbacteria bacterium]